MTTTGLASWEVDLTQVGAIYPFQGVEFLFIIITVLLWIAGLIVIVRREQARHESVIDAYATYEMVMAELDRLTASFRR